MRKEKLEELNQYKKELQLIEKKQVHSNPSFLKIEQYTCTLANEQVFNRELLVKGYGTGSAAVILPITESGNVLLVVQPRVFTASTVGVEVPAGYIENQEDPKEAAKRELLEETGYLAANLTLLTSYYQDQGISCAYNYVFLAEGCQKICEQKLDETEIIKYFECTYEEALELIKSGDINDVNSIMALEMGKQYRKERKYEI